MRISFLKLNAMRRVLKQHSFIGVLSLFVLCGLSANAWPYSAAGYSWPGAYTEVHVSFDVTNPAAYRPINAVSGLSNADFQQAYIDAMQDWSTSTNFHWVVNESGAETQPCKGVFNGAAFADRLCNEVEFGSSTLAAQTTFSSGSTAVRTFTIFNNNKLWNIYSGSGTGNDFKRVAVHELGHGLGLNHAGSNSIMYEFVSSIEVPQTDDINGVNSVYASSAVNDIDSDGVANAIDNCPLVSNAGQSDSDGDGTGNACDLDTNLADYDEDGVLNGFDNCPLDKNDGQQDSDSDSIGDLCDLDRDGDGISNLADNCPDESNAGQENLDSDDLGDACDDDSDGDGVLSYETADVSHEYSSGSISGSVMPAGPTGTANTAFELYGQTFEVNTTGLLTAFDLPFFCPDGDTIVELRNVTASNRPGSTIYATQAFSESSGILPKNSSTGFTRFEFSTPFSVSAGGDYSIYISITGSCFMFTSSTSYSDGVGWLGSPSWASIGGDYRFRIFIEPATLDNCPLVANASQADSNFNGIGDACDPLTLDEDSDGVVDALDNCPSDANASQTDTDGDLIGDACDSDDDNDGLSDLDEIGIHGTDPLDEDTDDDGVNDGDEIAAGTDPLNPPVINIPLPVGSLWLLALILLGSAYRKRYNAKKLCPRGDR